MKVIHKSHYLYLISRNKVVARYDIETAEFKEYSKSKYIKAFKDSLYVK